MDPHARHVSQSIDSKALRHFLSRSQTRLQQMQSLMTAQSPTVDARTLQSMIQYSREISFGAEVAALLRVARAADGIERLASESLHATVLDPIGFTARLGEQLVLLEVELKDAIEAEN